MIHSMKIIKHDYGEKVKMKYDKRLEGLVDAKNPEMSFNKVCDEIDEILSQYKQQSRMLRGLICHYEAQKSKEEGGNYILSIMYAVLVGIATIIASFNIESAIMMVLYLFIVVLLLSVLGVVERKRRYKPQFVLSCLKCKYEELYSKSQILSGDHSEEYKEYIVAVKERNK